MSELSDQFLEQAAASKRQSDLINTAIRRAAGYAPQQPHPADEIPEDADTFTREALTQGVPADLVDVARSLVPADLSGAALRSDEDARGTSRAARSGHRAPARARRARRRRGPRPADGAAGRRHEPDAEGRRRT